MSAGSFNKLGPLELSIQGRTGRRKGNQKGVDETQVDRYFFSKHFLKLNEYFRLFSEKLKTSVNQQVLLKSTNISIFLPTVRTTFVEKFIDYVMLELSS